jgi:hypothetical protein
MKEEKEMVGSCSESAEVSEPIDEVTDNSEIETPNKPKPRAIRRRFIPLQESTFSSASRVQKVQESSPALTSGTVMMRPRISANKRDTTTSQQIQKKSYFVVSDEMGRPIHPEPTRTSKGLFEVRDEMGNIIPTSPSPRPKSTVKTAENDRTLSSPVSSRGKPQSRSQALFTVWGESNFGASKEILTLSADSNKRLRYWNEINDNTCQEQYDAEQEPVKVDATKSTIDNRMKKLSINEGASATDRLSVAEALDTVSPTSDEISIRSESTDSPPVTNEIPSPPPTVADTTSSEAKESRSVQAEDLFIVTDEMGRRLNAPPAPKPKGLFEVRDEMGNVISPDPATSKATSTVSTSGMAIPKMGLSKFTATQQLFKVSGESGFVAPIEIMEL